MIVAANGSFVDAIASVDDVASISNFYLNEKLSKELGPLLNEAAGNNIIGAAAAHARGYDGSTQIAAVSDTGLGGGTTTTAHPDIPSSRMVAVYNWPGAAGGCFQSITNDGAIDVDSGYGTHGPSVSSAMRASGFISLTWQEIPRATSSWITWRSMSPINRR